MEIIEQLTLHSGKIFWQVINLSLTGSMAILAILTVRLLLKKIPKRFSYALWSVAAFRLVCPVSFSSAISLFSLNLFRQASLAGNRQDTLTYLPADTVLVPVRQTIQEIAASSAVYNGSLTPTLPPALPAADSAVQLSTNQILVAASLVFWLAGLTIMLLYGVISYSKIKRHVVGCIRLSGNVFESERITTPFILGFFRPKIYLPIRLSEHERIYILQHERFHIRRGDHLVKPLAFAVLAIHWFNPLAWLAYSSMLRDMEMRCDEAVLKMGGLTVKRHYSESLLALATRTRLPAASPLAFGESGVKARVKNVLQFHKPKTWILLGALVVCLGVVFIIAANPADHQSEWVPNDDRDLNEAVHQAVLAKIEQDYSDPQHEFVAEGHTVLQAVASGNRVTAYAIVLEKRYTFNDQGVAHFSGSHMPVALTFQKPDDQTYRLIEYWIPEDGTGYGRSIRRKFPEDLVDQAMNLPLFLDERELACNTQVLDYYEATYNPLHMLTGNQDYVAEFLNLAEDIGFDKLPRMYPDDICYNVTPEYIENQTGCMIFKYNESCESFLLADGKIYPLGTGFGGFGLTDIQLCDFDRNGKEDLLYTYSWGSGMHRSEIGLFNLTTKEETRLGSMNLTSEEMEKMGSLGFMMNELYLMKLDEDHFVVYTAEYVHDSAYKNLGFAHISLARKERFAAITADRGEISIKPLLD